MKQARTEAEEKQQQAQKLRCTIDDVRNSGWEQIAGWAFYQSIKCDPWTGLNWPKLKTAWPELRAGGEPSETMTAAADRINNTRSNIATLQASHPANSWLRVTTDIEQLRATLVETMQLLTTAKINSNS